MIVTFYSYKGGVGRSMALANVGDLLARAGLRVLMVDFDLEAPGLERYFPINQEGVRRNPGLLDLLLRYKRSMSLGAPENGEAQAFKRLNDFIVPVYDQLPSGGRLDLMPAGRRDGEHLVRYALDLRTFDWQDFYFNWEGELFFEWLRRSLTGDAVGPSVERKAPYDVVLVDSRTGVTEMGGVCAYQLADTLVMLCAANHQNLDGTRDMVRDFFSPRVTALRRDRSLQLMVVPARVELRDEDLLQEFRSAFTGAFAADRPPRLQRAGLDFWDLLIPYEPRYAFEERVLTGSDDELTRRAVGEAYRRLVGSLALLAEPATKLAELAPAEAKSFPTSREAAPEVQPRYDVTQRFAGYDVYLSYSTSDREIVEQLARHLQVRTGRTGLRVFRDATELVAGDWWAAKLEAALANSRAILVCLGRALLGQGQAREFRLATELISNGRPLRIIPVLLPGVESELVPEPLRQYHWVDFRSGLDDSLAWQSLLASVTRPERDTVGHAEIVNPYRGLAPYGEGDAPLFFRERLVAALVERLGRTRLLIVAGPSGCGKTSLVRAGLFPALRRGAWPGSDTWPIVTLRVRENPFAELDHALAEAFPGMPHASSVHLDLIRTARELVGGQSADTERRRLVLFVDQAEELFTTLGQRGFTQGTASSALAHAANPEGPAAGVLAFMSLLRRAADDPAGPVTVILALRSDFLDVAQGFDLGRPDRPDELFMVPPMTAEELRDAAERPARSVGLAFEPGVVDRIVLDAADQPGVLPLLQFTLCELWQRRRGGWLTNEAYAQIGGPDALARLVDEVYEQLAPSEQVIARRVFMRLVRVDEGTLDSRCRVSLTELLPAAPDEADATRKVINRLTDARLLVVSRGGAAGRYRDEDVVELAHDSLIRAWHRLVGWIEQDRPFLRRRGRLHAAADEWQNRDRDPALLLRGSALAEAEGWLSRQEELTATEVDFIRSSVAHQRIKGLRRGRRTLFTVGVVNLFIAATILVVASVRTKTSLDDVREARRVILAELKDRNAASAEVLVSPEGNWVFRNHEGGQAALIHFGGAKLLQCELQTGEAPVTAASFSRNERLLAVGDRVGIVRVWRVPENPLRRPNEFPRHPFLDRPVELQGPPFAVNRLAFDPRGSLVAAAFEEGGARVWPLTGTGVREPLELLKHKGPVIDVRFSADGDSLITTGVDGTVRYWDHAGVQIRMFGD